MRDACGALSGGVGLCCVVLCCAGELLMFVLLGVVLCFALVLPQCWSVAVQMRRCR